MRPKAHNYTYLMPKKKFNCRYCKADFIARGRRLKVCPATDCTPERIKLLQEAKIKQFKSRGLL